MIYAFAGCELDVERRELTRQGEPVDVEPKVFELLLHLARHHDRVVTRQELLESVWPGVVVVEGALARAVSLARAAVGDRGGKQAQVIRTLRGAGYRLVAEVVLAARAARRPGRRSPMTPQFRSMLGSLAGLLLASSTVQAATIGFEPDVTIASPGDAFVVDVVVSDLGGEIVGAYDLDVVFDSSVVSASSVTFSAALGGAAEAFLDFRVAPGLVDLAGVSLLSDAALLVRQGGERVTLASLHFTKTGEGSSPLAFVFDAVNDVKGAEARVLALAVSPGAVRGPREVIPEPSGALTFATGLSVTTWALRRRSRRVPVRSR